MPAELGITETTLTYKTLIADDQYGMARIPATLTGGSYVAGQILGRITASGKLTAYDALAADGSEAPVAVLLADCDASAEDQEIVAGFGGVYVEANITGLDTAGRLALEARGLYFV